MEAVEEYIFGLKISSFKLSETFKSVVQGVLEMGKGGTMCPSPGWNRVKGFKHASSSGFHSQMWPVRIRHSSHDFAPQSSHSVDLARWQAKMVSIEIWLP